MAATGGSTNAALHLPALANEIGVKFDLMDVAKIFKKDLYLVDLNLAVNMLQKICGRQEECPCC